MTTLPRTIVKFTVTQLPDSWEFCQGRKLLWRRYLSSFIGTWFVRCVRWRSTIHAYWLPQSDTTPLYLYIVHYVQWGSVITCVDGGRSLYARVQRFIIKVDGDDCAGYVSVTWFGVPDYLLDNRLVLRFTETQLEELVDEVDCILRITHIDPSQVMVERTMGTYCWMMRDSGYDTVLED